MHQSDGIPPTPWPIIGYSILPAVALGALDLVNKDQYSALLERNRGISRLGKSCVEAPSGLQR